MDGLAVGAYVHFWYHSFSFRSYGEFALSYFRSSVYDVTISQNQSVITVDDTRETTETNERLSGHK